MTKFAVLYAFSEGASAKALHRLRRLQKLNPEVEFFPVVGLRQTLYFPMILDGFMFGSVRELPVGGQVFHTINWLASAAPGIFRLSESINKKVDGYIRRSNLVEIKGSFNRKEMPPLHLDFTPMGLWNLDHMVLSWFKNVGKFHEFDYLIYYEYDTYTTAPLASIYEKYTESFDACFSDYKLATKSWRFYRYPPGSRILTKRWLARRMLETTLYGSLFAGAFFSRRCFEKLEKLRIDFSGTPYCQVEMRMPTLLNALGFKCGKLNFPFVRYRPVWSEKQIRENEVAGIFHPVKELVSEEHSW